MTSSEPSRKRGRKEVPPPLPAEPEEVSPPAEPVDVPPHPPKEMPPPTPAEVKQPPPKEVK
jgi:hypothetical protein